MSEAVLNDAGHDYSVVGEGEPPIFFVAGMGGAAGYWAPQVQHFAKTHKVISYDQRGTGKTAHVPVASIDQLAEDALALLDHLGVDKVHYVGHSTGGAIGQRLAVMAPDRFVSLTLYASIARADAFRSRIWAQRIATLEHFGPLAYAKATTLALYPPHWIAANDERLCKDEEVSAKALPPADVMASRINAILTFDNVAELKRITAPTMVLCAQNDTLTPLYFSEEIAREIPGAKLVVAEDGAHAVSRTDPDWFNRTLEDFWASL